jgi:hypothetical protein
MAKTLGDAAGVEGIDRIGGEMDVHGVFRLVRTMLLCPAGANRELMQIIYKSLT